MQVKKTREERIINSKIPTTPRINFYENSVKKCLENFWSIIDRIPEKSRESVLKYVLKVDSSDEIQKIKDMREATPIYLIKRIDEFSRKLEILFEREEK